MVFSVSPSVTVREVDATAVIPAISSTQAAIAGPFLWGPENEPVLITSEKDLTSRFGKPTGFNAETFFVAADFLAYSNALYVTRVIENAENANLIGSPFIAKYKGSLGNSLNVSYITSADAYSKQIIDLDLDGITATIVFNGNQLVFTSQEDLPLTDITTDDILRVGNNNVGYQDMRVASFAKAGPDGDGAFTYTLNFNNRYTLATEDGLSLILERRWKYYSSVSGAPSTNSIHIVVADNDGKISNLAGSILEVFENVSTIENARLEDGSTNNYKVLLENRSSWVSHVENENIVDSDLPYHFNFVGGSDGNGENTSTLLSFGALAAGYDSFTNSEEIDIAFVLQGKAMGGANNTGLANYIIANVCEVRKDCVLFISPALADVVTPSNPNDKLNSVIIFRNQLQNSSYWFMDSGYKYRYDKYNDVYRWVPLNGDIAGLWARIDPWESAAGYRRGIIKNVIKLAFNPNKAQRDVLYGKDVNPVISQAGQGTLLFGDKTGLSTPSAFSRLNVRRLFIVVEKAIATTSRIFLFEFNDEFTQTQFKNLVEPLLRDIQGKRGIIDFRVVSDSTINTPDVIDRNIFRGNIFIKPARTINFIELTFIATRTGVEFDEIVGQPF
jgi:hypothetical protein